MLSLSKHGVGFFSSLLDLSFALVLRGKLHRFLVGEHHRVRHVVGAVGVAVPW